MMHRKGYVLPLTFLLLISMTIVVGSLVYVITAQFKGQGSDIAYAKCQYYAEAGMAKAIWYLKGGNDNGFRWRRTSLTESFGDGSYRITVENGNDPLQVKITIRGNCGAKSRTLQAYYYTYPPAFNYAVFSTQALFNMFNNSSISNASVYADNNVYIGPGARINNGLFVTAGHAVTGEGSYILYPIPFPAPSFPTLDTSYYDSQIAIAAQASPGDRSYHWPWPIPNPSIYVNGNVYLDTTVYGSGQIVATGNINIQSSAYISSNISIISGGNLVFEDHASVQDDCVLFARQQMTIQSVDNQNHVSFVCPGQINVANNAQLDGIMYGGSVTFGNTAYLYGSLMAGNYGTQNVLQNNARVYYYHSHFPTVPPPGLAGAYSQVSGSWKEIK